MQKIYKKILLFFELKKKVDPVKVLLLTITGLIEPSKGSVATATLRQIL